MDRDTLVPDESRTIDEGAVAPWNTLMWSLMTDVCREMGVRTDVPFRELTEKEKDIVYNLSLIHISPASPSAPSITLWGSSAFL